MMEEIDLKTIVEAYLQAFDARDMPRCMTFYDEDATLTFGPGSFQGKKAIERWHKDRFAADMRLVKLEEIEVQSNTVIVQGVATSRLLKRLKVGTLSGTATFQLQGDKIKELAFDARIGASTEIGWRRM